MKHTKPAANMEAAVFTVTDKDAKDKIPLSMDTNTDESQISPDTGTIDIDTKDTSTINTDTKDTSTINIDTKDMGTIDTAEKTPAGADTASAAFGHVRDANSRTIFKNARLTSQFLRDYSNIPIFANVQPEDIEDVTEHYHAFLGVGFDADTVKRVRVTLDGTDREVFVIPLIEHKSYVDYDVSMQLFRYMSVIWYTYAKQQNTLQKNVSHTKQFRYPLIIPIVYYEGTGRWTADLHLKDRIENADRMSGYIPDFKYHLVNCRGYTNEELTSKNDEMSLVMLMNRIQNPKDYSDFFENLGEYAKTIYDNAPEDIKQVYTDIIWSLLIKMNVPVAEAQEIVEKLEVSNMGYLFENAEKMDIQAERQNTKEARKEAELAKREAADARQKIADVMQEAADAKQEAADAKQEAADARQKVADAKQEAADARQKAAEIENILDIAIKNILCQGKASGKTKEEMQRLLQNDYGMKESDALQKINAHWE